MKRLETKRLILRDWEEADTENEVFSKEVTEYLIDKKNNYAVVLKENSKIIGTVGLNEDAEEREDTRNVGIRILEPYQNKGFISEVLETIIENAYEITNNLSYLCLTDDKRSQHIAEKFNFNYVKTFYGAKSKNNDEPKDFHYYIRSVIKNKVANSRCGLHCTGCVYKETNGCKGCIETNGKPFHGACPVAFCCQSKGFVHCGECPTIPCKLLFDYSCDKEHGDTPPGARIAECKRWAKCK